MKKKELLKSTMEFSSISSFCKVIPKQEIQNPELKPCIHNQQPITILGFRSLGIPLTTTAWALKALEGCFLTVNEPGFMRPLQNQRRSLHIR